MAAGRKTIEITDIHFRVHTVTFPTSRSRVFIRLVGSWFDLYLHLQKFDRSPSICEITDKEINSDNKDLMPNLLRLKRGSPTRE